MALRTQFQNSSDIGVFVQLTNSYCLVPVAECEAFYSVFEGELADVIKVSNYQGGVLLKGVGVQPHSSTCMATEFL